MDTRTDTQTGAKLSFEENLAQSIEHFSNKALADADPAVTRGLVQLLRIVQGPGSLEEMTITITNSIAAAIAALAIVSGSPSDAVMLVMKIAAKHGLDLLTEDAGMRRDAGMRSPQQTKGTPQ